MKSQKNQGFTLIELMIVVAIAGILALVAIPNFLGWLPKHRLGLAAQDVQSSIHKARSRAVRDNSLVVFQADAANNRIFAFKDDGDGTADTDNDNVPDGQANGVQDGVEQTVVNIPIRLDVNFTAAFQTSFDRRGFPDPNNIGTITLTNAQGQTRQVELLITGNTRMPGQ